MSINRGRDRYTWYMYTMEYDSVTKKKKIMPFTATWMDLEIVIMSEVRHRKTNIVSYQLHVQSKKRRGTNELTYKTEVESWT